MDSSLVKLLPILFFCTVFQILAFSKFSVFLNYFVRFSEFSVQKIFSYSPYPLSFLVEARGVEPLSESTSSGPSPGADDSLHSLLRP